MVEHTLVRWYPFISHLSIRAHTDGVDNYRKDGCSIVHNIYTLIYMRDKVVLGDVALCINAVNNTFVPYRFCLMRPSRVQLPATKE